MASGWEGKVLKAKTEEDGGRDACYVMFRKRDAER